MKQTYGSPVYQKYGLVDAFNPLTNWTSSAGARDRSRHDADRRRKLPIKSGLERFRSDLRRPAGRWPRRFHRASTAVWAVNGSGNWNVAANWTNGTIPNAVGAVAELLDDHSSGTDCLFTTSAITEGTLHFNSANEYETRRNRIVNAAGHRLKWRWWRSIRGRCSSIFR